MLRFILRKRMKAEVEKNKRFFQNTIIRTDLSVSMNNTDTLILSKGSGCEKKP